MFLWLFVAVLGIILFVLAAYSLPASQGAFQPGSDFMLGLMTQVGAMMIEIVAIVKLSVYFSDRKWEPVRDQLRNIIWADFKNVLNAAIGWPSYQAYANNPQVALSKIGSDLDKILRYLNDDSVRENVQFMTAGFTPS